MDEYHRMLNDFRQSYQEKVAAGLVSSHGEALATLTKLRHAASKAKVTSAVELAREVLEQDSQVVIFGAFKDTQYLVASALGAEVLNGDTPQNQRDGIVKRFQAGRTKALVCAFGVAGVGITLTAADTVILIDRGWTPTECLQAEDRIHRISQTVPTRAVWVQAFDIDFRIDGVLQSKQDRINLVLEGKRKTMRGVDKFDAKQMLASIMAA
jgi:SNF2 family DNA or RNA helicase